MKKMKLVPYILTFSLAMSSLTSCSFGSDDNNDNLYTISSEGEISFSGTLSYDKFKKYKLIELKLMNNQNELFIVSETLLYAMRHGAVIGVEYTNVFTNKRVYINDNGVESLPLVNEFGLEDYLITYDEVKDFYTLEDIERIYNKILEDYEFEKEKILVNE